MISGSIGITRSGRYTLVARSCASRSSGVFGCTKCDTSAMCTPSSQWPLSSRSSEIASSKSRASTGSIVMIVSSVRSRRPRPIDSSNLSACLRASSSASSANSPGRLNS